MAEYEVSELSVAGEPRAGDAFYPTVTVCCRGVEECPRAEVVLTLAGQRIATATVDLEPGECAAVTPSARQPFSVPGWLEVSDGGVTPTQAGRMELAAVVGTSRAAEDLIIAPGRVPVDSSNPVEECAECRSDHA